MITKRRLRFSIGAILVLMTGVAVLLNHEVQRAKAIETTVTRIEEWGGRVNFRPRACCPRLIYSVLPKYWMQEIDSIVLVEDSRFSTDGSALKPNCIIHRREVEKLFQLGALNDLKYISLMGNVFDYDFVYSLCESTSAEECNFLSGNLTDQEIAALKESFPHCKFISAGWWYEVVRFYATATP